MMLTLDGYGWRVTVVKDKQKNYKEVTYTYRATYDENELYFIQYPNAPWKSNFGYLTIFFKSQILVK